MLTRFWELVQVHCMPCESCEQTVFHLQLCTQRPRQQQLLDSYTPPQPGGAIHHQPIGRDLSDCSPELSAWVTCQQAQHRLQHELVLAEDRLLQAVVWNDSHVLRGLFPPKNSRRPGLRARMHNFDLPCKDDENFVSRVLYKHINRVPKAIN